MKRRYKAIKADIDEKAIRHTDPRQLVALLAEAKAEALRPQVESLRAEFDHDADSSSSGRDLILITCDQVVTHEGRILEKPENEAEARSFIEGYGRCVWTRTLSRMIHEAICLLAIVLGRY